jgi:hypothetical protein
VLPIAVGVVSLATFIVGAALVGSTKSDFDKLNDPISGCAPNCDPSVWQGLPPREHGGEALLAIGGAGLAVDAGLWALEAKKRPPVRAGLGGVAVEF